MNKYRIKFDPDLGRWILQICVGMFRWRTVVNEHGGVLKFKTLEALHTYIENIGLKLQYSSHKSILSSIPQYYYAEQEQLPSIK
jgi:hypothetical protein